MKRTIFITIFCIVAAGYGYAGVSPAANGYANFQLASQTAKAMSYHSSHSGEISVGQRGAIVNQSSNNTFTLSSIGADSPVYIAAQSGDLNPFGASASAGPRRAPGGKTGGDKENPDIEGPLSDGVWLLCTLALLFAARKLIVRRRQAAMP